MSAKLYSGTLRHARYTPKKHSFTYKVFMPFVELETLSQLTEQLPLWSAKRWAPARFLRSDFLGPKTVPLADAVRLRIHAQTGRHHDGPIYLLANWRYFGYQNNPIAVYYCYDKPGGCLQYVVAEVTNTPWGERHSYVLKAPAGEGPLVTEFDKALHVSPFNPMEMTYRWHSDSPGASLAIQIALFQKNERIFDAVLSLSAEPLNARSAVLAILSYPLMTLKVVLGIYWEALRLFLKGVSLHSHPKRSH
ncbi:MAG: DUF1365 domain-containing protein [Luminiphilus sp.]|jgi:uncharacterized protein|nr:DUF1365 domain-containing protein [Luminiphilus sp.]MBL6896912.1 DUF1365 domain-containing protein [Luminiphilus sp.]MBT6352965.1 DUF1365 domain-containing protein [Halieaceae bacterium]